MDNMEQREVKKMYPHVLNFFNSNKTTLPTNIDLMLKLIVLLPIPLPYLYKNRPNLPFLDFITEIDTSHLNIWFICISILTIIGVIITLFNIAPRFGGGLILISLFTNMIWCSPCYADSRFYLFSILLLLVLFQKNYGIKILRWQVVILYFGSGLNKLLDQDWQTGIYINNWLGYQIQSQLYIDISNLLPELLLAKVISWSVIAIELLMSWFFTKKSYFKMAIWLGLIMHGSSVILGNGIFGSFVVTVMISYLAFLEWPKTIVLSLPKTRLSYLIKKYAVFLDPYNKFKIQVASTFQEIELQIDNNKFVNFQALKKAIMYTPAFYFGLITIFIMPGFGYNWLKGVFLLLLTGLSLPITGKMIDYVWQQLSKQKK